MKSNSLTNQDFAALANGLPVPLDITFSSTGAGTAWISGNYIIIDITTAIALDTTITLTTPIDFDFVNMWSIKGNAQAGVVLTAKNASGLITDAISLTTADKTIDKATDIIDLYRSFTTGDDDLVFLSATAAFLGRIVVEIDK